MISLTATVRKLFNLALYHHCPLCEAQCRQATLNTRQNCPNSPRIGQFTQADYLCLDCQRTLEHIQLSCLICDLPLATRGICPECQRCTHAYDRIRCAYIYTPMLATLIFRYKSGEDLALGRQLSQSLIQAVRCQLRARPEFTPDFLVPVPMYWRAQFQRGFNQAEDIAQHLSHHLGIPILEGITKTNASSSQKDLNRKARLRAQEKIKYQVHGDVLNRNIAIIDDVVTTAATAQTLSKLIKEAGAKRAEVWALARTPVTK